MQAYDVLDFSEIKTRVAAYASFSLGKAHVLALQPVFQKLYLQRELALLEESLRFYTSFGAIPFGGIFDIQAELGKAKKGMILNEQELKYVAMQSHAIQTIRSHFEQNGLAAGELSDLIATLQAFPQVQKEIDHCINELYEVMDQASPKLNQVRKEMRNCEKQLTTLTQALLSKHASSLQENISAYRNDRLCLLVKVSDKNKVKGIVHAESASGLAVYIEPLEIMELNNQMQTLKYEEHVEIEVILKGLSALVQANAEGFLANLETLTIIDSLFARAAYGHANNGCVARLHPASKHLVIKSGRHPLIDAKKVVANTYEIKDETHILLISGPNTGGKTVTLKTIGLFVLMSYAGLPILCEEAQIPLYDQIFVDIGDDQSILSNLSTFSAHLAKLANITKHCTPNSLILLDELGSGTDPNEGEALAMAILDYLREQNARVIATTHYAKLKTYATNYEDIMLSCVEFDLENLQPTYRFLMNISGQSNAFDIALRYGLPAAIVHHAKAFKEQNKTDSERAMEQLERLLLENDRLQQELQEQAEAMAISLANTKNMESAMERQKAHVLREAVEKANRIIEEAQEEAIEVIDELRANTQAKPHELLQIKAKLQAKQQEEEVQQPNEQKPFAVGDYILFKQYNYYGEVTEINGKKVSILANGMKMNTTVDNLEHSKRPQANKQRSKGKISDSFNRSFSMELNLLGYRVDEAIAMVDKYLDNALYAKVFEVRIVHGVGTGALRKAVQGYLKTSKLVESYRFGMQSEGGLGATVVKLKRKKGT
ncbi:MAG: endonuclease MutS2 [Erysipelotrichaceae bacterium]